MKRLLLIVPCLFAAGCASTSDDTADTSPTPTATPAGIVDLRKEIPPPPEGGIQILTPDLTIKARTEIMYCFVTTYNGPDEGIVLADHYQAEYGHHLILLGTNLDVADAPDGTVFDCTDPSSMTDANPIYIGDILEGTASREFFKAPSGYAAKLKAGTRMYIQSHYVNTSDQDILVRDGVNLSLVDPAAVNTWIAPFTIIPTEMPLIANAATQVKISCAWEQSGYLLFLGGHMHEHGTSMTVDTQNSDGSSARLYDVDEWKTEYRDTPPMEEYSENMQPVHAGDIFTTTCNFYNDTDQALDFPHEMCAVFGSFYPSTIPFICDPDPEITVE